MAPTTTEIVIGVAAGAAVAAGAPHLELLGVKLFVPPTMFGKEPAGTMDLAFKVFFPEDHLEEEKEEEVAAQQGDDEEEEPDLDDLEFAAAMS